MSAYRIQIESLQNEITYLREALQMKERIFNVSLGLTEDAQSLSTSRASFTEPLQRFVSPAKIIARLEADSRIKAKEGKE